MNDDQFSQKSEGPGGTKFKVSSQESGIGAGTQLPQSTLGGIKLLAYEDPKAATSFLLHKKGKVLGGDFAAAVKSSRVLDSKQKEILGEVAQLTSAIQDELPDEKASLLQEKEEGVVKSIEIRQRQSSQQQILPGQYEIVIQREEVPQSIYVSFVQAPVVAGQAPSQLLQLPSVNFPGTGPIVDLIRSPAERLVKGQLDKVTKKAYAKIGKKLGGKALKKSATKIAASAAVKLSARLGIHLAANTIAPIVGELVVIAADLAVKTAKKAVRIGKKAVKYAAAIGLAVLLGLGSVISAVMGQALVITLIVFPILVAIILFIINTSAFLVPYGPEVGSDGSIISGGGYPPGFNYDSTECPSNWPVNIEASPSYYVNQGPGGSASHNICYGTSCWQEAIDIHPDGPLDTNVHLIVATFTGTAYRFNDNEGGLGVEVRGECSGIKFRAWYSHMSTRIAKSGSIVSNGDILGVMGQTGHASSGPHIHYEFVDDSNNSIDRSGPPPYMENPFIPVTVPTECVGRVSCGINVP